MFGAALPGRHEPATREPPRFLQVSALFTGYVASMLKEYSTSPEQGWKAKDCAIFLVLALAVQGKTAAAGGGGLCDCCYFMVAQAAMLLAQATCMHTGCCQPAPWQRQSECLL